MTERGDVMRSDRFKQVMLELDPSFSEKSIGFSKFNRFLTESASRGILDLHKAANGQYEVAIGARVGEYDGGGSELAASTAEPSTEPAQTARREAAETRPRSRGRAESGRSSRTERGGRRGRSRGGREEKMSREAPPSVDEDRLRAAYELLRSVVADKAARGPVRDSEVKRQMVERDPDFDEAALGFRKFSRFLRQAHDEEVITLERTGEGNYKIASVAGGETAATPAPRAEEAAPEVTEEKGKSRGRRDRKERSGRRSRGSRASEKAADESEASADAQPPAEEAPVEETVQGESPAAEAETSASPVADAPAAPAAPGFAPTGLTGRRRRSSSRSQPSAGPVVVPGPVDSDDGDEKASAPKDDGGSATAQPVTPATRTMGRFRKGSRGPGAPGTGESASRETAEAVEASAGGGSASELTPEQQQLVENMARGYQGVGRRTAERLVQEFGDRVLDVIDNEPGRIESVLPRGRAQAVIEGRRAEREG